MTTNARIREALRAPGGPFTVREVAEALGVTAARVRSVCRSPDVKTISVHQRIKNLKRQLSPVKRKAQ